ncbi:hypothetical protein BC777_3228 [Yoonia maricola]|uniref:Uncharacterized protein n=1 Tax=Yoonia maricola TaxID=420999 RepID=A0A2M8W2U1_9RHOB|nr:hypothetical protein [Yoonia maricola]PJI85228.1 hypothetical protein BC777_3228 [Yoonia maricola]
MSVVLILGSGPNVVTCRDWPKAPFDRIVAINNAWAVRPDWDDLIHPDDFPVERMPLDVSSEQRIIRASEYVPLQNTLGGFVYAGGTMAFTASYWALAALKPRVIAVLGCDMVYAGASNTHFYGTGTADPLRKDVTLRSLEAKSARLMAMAARQNCAMVNLSTDESRLVFPRSTAADIANARPQALDQKAIEAALAEEARLGYYVPSGKYWKEESRFDTAAIDALDALWLKSTLPLQTGS